MNVLQNIIKKAKNLASEVMWEEKLKEVKDFNNYMNSSVLEKCEAA